MEMAERLQQMIKTYERLLQLRITGRKRYYHSIKVLIADWMVDVNSHVKMPFLDEWNERRWIVQISIVGNSSYYSSEWNGANMYITCIS